MATTPSANDPRLDPKRQILLHLDVGLIKDLKKAAVDLEVSASSLAGQAIDAWLREQGRRTTPGGDT